MLPTQMQPPYPGSQRSWFMAIAITAFVILTGFSIYSALLKNSLQGEVNSLKVKKEALSTPAAVFQKSGADAAISVIAAKNALSRIESSQLQWAKIIDKIESTVPKLKDTAAPVVTLKSYNGTEDGKVSISAGTRSDAFDPFADISLLIRTFTNEPAFKHVFVPSITKTLTSDGSTILSFSINFEYSKASF